jgi:hypothetical protein
MGRKRMLRQQLFCRKMIQLQRVMKLNLVIGQTAFTCRNQVEEVWQHQVRCYMLLEKHIAS